MICERCKKGTGTTGCGENIDGFRNLIILCESCDKDWGKVWAKSRIINLHGNQYQKAYYKLFWNWFGNGKEVVQFS